MKATKEVFLIVFVEIFKQKFNIFLSYMIIVGDIYFLLFISVVVVQSS